MKLAWGRKVSPEFRARVIAIAENIEIDPSHLMACIAFETGQTFSPSIRNKKSNATGLIQFMRTTAIGLGTTIDDLAKMDAVRQLDFVEKFFRPFKGKIHTVSDIYMVILWQRAVGKPEDYHLFEAGGAAYAQNAGLDADGDGAVTKAEAAARIETALTRGLRPENAWDDEAGTSIV